MNAIDITGSTGEWLRGSGPESDIVICTRARLARNVDGFAFSPMIQEEEARELNKLLSRRVLEAMPSGALKYTDLLEATELDRQVLLERHLISRELSGGTRARGVVISGTEDVSIMINEEDHLRLQVFRSGFRVEDAWLEVEKLDEAIGGRLRFAFSEDYGFLTACPTNVGTGLRISAMLHLPGLVWSKQIEKAHNAVQKLHLAVRGLYGEGSRATGDFYQISNQVTLGRPESDIRRDVALAVLKIVTWEREIRQELFEKSRIVLEDRVMRALGVLERARTLTSEEALDNLSHVRVGIHLGLIKELEIPKLNRLLLLTQPGHLQVLEGRPLEPAERDVLRARRVRQILGMQ
jgi:protein arginine kinase